MTAWSFIGTPMVFCTRSSEPCRWRRRKEARPEEILDAALTLFTLKGFSATRMDDVAKQAGISKGTLYLYFDSKDAIFRSVVETLIGPQLKQIEKRVDEFQGSNEELLRELVQGWWRNVAESNLSAIPKLIVSESGNFPELAEYFVNNVVKRMRKVFIRVIDRGISSGEFRDCDSKAAARLLQAPVVQAVIWKHSMQQWDDAGDARAYISLHLDIFFKGLKA
jgi:AcrR family transcriptional regulator